MAFALLLKGLGVISGMRATAGDLNIDMNRSTSAVITMNITRLRELSAIGMKNSAILVRTVPASMKGIRFPIGVCSLSERVPNRGRRKSASILSIAMIAPMSTSFNEKLFLRISGMMLSYICQKAMIDMKAKPTMIVLYL